MALKYAIHRYHKTEDAENARKFLQESVDRHFKNEARSTQILECLDRYMNWCGQTGVVVSDSKVPIKLNLGVWLELKGEVHRLDVLESGYRAILLGEYPRDWSAQIRMPLLQRAVAYRYGRPAEAVSIGVQRFDGSGLVVQKFLQSQIQSAETEFKELSSRLHRYARSYPNLIDM
jgi:hypothetical protein